MKTTAKIAVIGAGILAISCSLSSVCAQLYFQYDPPQQGTASSGHYAGPLEGKIYVRFDGGVALQQDITLSDSVGDSEKVSFDPGARLDTQFGYSFTENWAAELEFGFIVSPVKSSCALGTDYMNVDLVELPLLVNVIYTQPLGRHFSIYAGGGIGGVLSDYNNDYGGTTETASAFAYQGLAGIKYLINDRWELGIGYKFLGTTGYDVGSGIAWDENKHYWVPTEFHSDGNVTHSILVTLTCRF